MMIKKKSRTAQMYQRQDYYLLSYLYLSFFILFLQSCVDLQAEYSTLIILSLPPAPPSLWIVRASRHGTVMKWTPRVSGLRPALALLTIYCSLRERATYWKGGLKGRRAGVKLKDSDSGLEGLMAVGVMYSC